MASRRWLTVLTASLVMAFGLAACGVTGSGTIVSSVRDVPDFDGIEVHDGLHVEVDVAADRAQSVTVRYDDNLVDQIATRVDDGTLIIEIDGTVNLTGSGRSVEITVGRLVSINASGGASVSAEGTADRLSVSASVGASVTTGGLNAADVELDVSGGASVIIFATTSATGEASGGSSVIVLGTPETLDIARSGGSSVSKG